MEHMTESELAFYAFDSAAVPEDRRRAIETHTAECAECRAMRDFFAVAEDDFSDGDTWERGMGSATREALMAYAARIAEEDTAAEELLRLMFDVPARIAWANPHRQKKYLNGGVVRQLNARALALRESEPLDALTFADAAIAIAEALPDETYPGRAIYELRGKAWEHRAVAQTVLGEFGAALDSLDHAERAHKHLASPGFGLAAVALIRASVHYCQQQFDRAEAMAETAERAYAHLGDDERRISALFLRGGIKYERFDLDGAIAVFREVLTYGESTNGARWIARAASALGWCETDCNDLGAASMDFHKALTLLREIGPANERISADWGFARVLLRAGKTHEAIRRLRDAAAEFEARGIVTDAALVSLDIADGLLALGQTYEIVKLAARMFRVFTDARHAHGRAGRARIRQGDRGQADAHTADLAGGAHVSSALTASTGASFRAAANKSLRLQGRRHPHFGGFMRRVFWRGTKILAVAVLLLTPVAALADDPAIQPPFPHASSPARQATFWQIVRIVLLNA